MNDNSVAALSDLTVFMKYAKYVPEIGRRETWEELCERNMAMHIRKYPQLKEEIKRVYRWFVMPKKALPSMRSFQFAGAPIQHAPNRIFNCAYMPVEKVSAFSEAMFLLLGGTGVGYSVQRHHVAQLPPLQGPSGRPRRYIIGDSIEGWADAVKMLCGAYFYGKPEPIFDYSDIRPKGARLVTSGGKAPGPDPLRACLENLSQLFQRALDARGAGTKLRPIEVHDAMCLVADAVLAGGIRRAALIALFSPDDEEMMTCKSGAWWETTPYRARANNSAVLKRGEITQADFLDLWQKVEDSKAGEPGVYFTHDRDWGTNPCCEIALRPYQFCNLTELNVHDVISQEDLNERAAAAAFLGTLQAGYTNFHYLNEQWRETTEADALIGVGMTGIGSGAVLPFDLEEAAAVVKRVNRSTARQIGINPAARTTTVKPAGTSSLVLGSSSGIHAWHNDHYIRRLRVGKNEAIYEYLSEKLPALVADEYMRPHDQAVVEIPQKAPTGAILRHESPQDLLERVRRWNLEWVRAGHEHGVNSHNVSCTISVKDDEWAAVGQWMWDNRDNFNGISVLPYDGGTYQQAPFEDISEARFNELVQHLTELDLTQVREEKDNTDLTGEVACGAGGCEVL